MKTITLLQKSGSTAASLQQFVQHESAIFTLLIKLTGDDAEFSIECTGEDGPASYGVNPENSGISLNQPVSLEKDGANFQLKMKGAGVHYFQLDMSDESSPLLMVKADLSDSTSGVSGLDHFFDSKLPVSLEIGRTRMSIEEVLSCGQGSVIELHRLVGEELDVFVGGSLVAKAEVIVNKDQFGARLTRVLPVAEDMAKELNILTEEAV